MSPERPGEQASWFSTQLSALVQWARKYSPSSIHGSSSRTICPMAFQNGRSLGE